jgi:DnaK suppressor protein
MTPSKVWQHRRTLLERQAELIAGIRGRDAIAVDTSADEIERIQSALVRDVIIRDLDSRAILLRAIAAALDRMGDGSFGVCVSCETAISQKRLDAVPWAPCCIRCQEAAEREARGGDHELSESRAA